jgi:hypothetical protein
MDANLRHKVTGLLVAQKLLRDEWQQLIEKSRGCIHTSAYASTISNTVSLHARPCLVLPALCTLHNRDLTQHVRKVERA